YLCLRTAHCRFRRVDREALPLDLPLRHVDLAVERGYLRTRALHREFIRARVDDEQDITLLDALVVGDTELGDRTAHLRDDVYDVGHADRIVRLRIAHEALDDHEPERDRSRNEHEEDESSEGAARPAHVSSRTREAR